MKVQPIAGPLPVTQATTNNTDSRAKAIAAFSQGQATNQPIPPVNPNQVSAEELSAVKTQPKETIQEIPTETSQSETTQETKPKVDPKVQEQFDRLLRQEKVLRSKAQQADNALKARETALVKREADLAAKDTQFKSNDYISAERLKQDPLGVMAEQGLSYEQITQQIMSQQPTDPRVQATISRLESKIAELEQANQDSQKSYQDQQTQTYQAAVKQIRMDAQQLVNSDPNFETIKVERATNKVVELIEKTFQKDGIVLDVQEAAQLVEDELVERAVRTANTNKIKQRIAMNAKQQSPAAAQAVVEPKSQMKTLTNASSSSRPLSARERALLAFKGELKS